MANEDDLRRALREPPPAPSEAELKRAREFQRTVWRLGEVYGRLEKIDRAAERHWQQLAQKQTGANDRRPTTAEEVGGHEQSDKRNDDGEDNGVDNEP